MPSQSLILVIFLGHSLSLVLSLTLVLSLFLVYFCSLRCVLECFFGDNDELQHPGLAPCDWFGRVRLTSSQLGQRLLDSIKVFC